MVFMTGKPAAVAEVAPAEVAVKAVPATPEPTPGQQFEEGKERFNAGIDSAKSVVADLKAIYVDEKYGIDTNTTKDDDFTKLFGDLDTQLAALMTEFATKEAMISEKTQEALTTLEAELYTQVLTVLEDETTATLEEDIKKKTAETLGDGATKDSVGQALTQFEEKKAEEAKVAAEKTSDIPPYQNERATALLANKETGVDFDAKKVLDERGKDFSITSPDGYTIRMHVKPGDPRDTANAKLVMDYSSARFTQEFADQSAFSKFYKNISAADLPKAGEAAKPITDVSTLPSGKPPPFGGAKRTRELSVSVDADGKVKVEVLSIQFEPTIEIDLGKPFDQVKTVDDVLYPPGYGKGRKGGGGESAETQDAAVTATLESGEEPMTLEQYAKILKNYSDKLPTMEKIGADDPRLADLPQFLRKEITQIPSTLGSVIRGAELLVKEARVLQDQPGTSEFEIKMQEIAGVMKGLERYEPFLNKDTVLPQFKDFEKMKKEGLKYGEGGTYGVPFFGNHFKGAHDALEAHFQDSELLVNNGVYVELVGANLNFSGSGVGKQISGSFEMKVPGYEGSDTVKFDFSKIGPTDAGLSWESAVTNAMNKLIDDKSAGKAIDEQRDKKEDVDYRRRFVDFKEKDRLEKRVEKVAKGKSPSDVPDYKAKTENDLKKEIADDYGNPDEYSIKEYEGKWVAIRVMARGTEEAFGGERVTAESSAEDAPITPAPPSTASSADTRETARAEMVARLEAQKAEAKPS